MHIHIFGFVLRCLSKHQRNEGIFVIRNGIKERVQGVVNWKDCIVPYGKRKPVPPPPLPAAEKADTGQMLHLREPEVPREVRGCGVEALRGVGPGGEG